MNKKNDLFCDIYSSNEIMVWERTRTCITKL
jgi:hypothetical protein